MSDIQNFSPQRTDPAKVLLNLSDQGIVLTLHERSSKAQGPSMVLTGPAEGVGPPSVWAEGSRRQNQPGHLGHRLRGHGAQLTASLD